ncbi:MAG: carbonic anhydrase family protein [Bryobacter sp.]|jgi:carbonic anhydrase|nr:carbonic anhydrase family protein [Bryobacter sp.]
MKLKHYLGSATLLGAALWSGCTANPPAPPKAEAPQKPAAKTRPIAPAKEDPHWGYEAPDGPKEWGKLSPKFSACGAGKAQSPIDIDKARKSELPALQAQFRPAELKIIHHEHMADIVNTGHSIQINYTEGDKLKLGDEEFELIQYHFHSPSEHTVAGKQYAMEMHLVHKSASGKLAVIGVFGEEGAPNPAFDPVWANLPGAKSIEHHLEHVKVDVNELLPKNTTSYRYTGSLTTPPCSEDVKWIVMANPVQLSKQQIDSFRAIMKGNNRPVQALNGRPVVTDHIAEKVSR